MMRWAVLTVGSVVAGYRIERVLGSGGMGSVYFVVVYFNEAGETSQLVMNHRPQSAALLFSSLLTEHFGDAFDPNLFYDGDVSAHLLHRDLSRGLWPPSSR